MRHENQPTEASRQYATAYAAHYSARDLPWALRLYQGLVASHPSDVEADYARTQIQNIVNSVVPKQDLLDAQMKLLPAQFHRDRPTVTDVAPTLRV
jgi:predicted Zn-dependent protease